MSVKLSKELDSKHPTVQSTGNWDDIRCLSYVKGQHSSFGNGF